MTPPVRSKVTSKFGERTHPVTKKQGFHNGVDLRAAIGTPVKAPANGRVTEVFETAKGGICLAMVSDDGIRFGFAHLSERHVRWHDRVTEGEVIALSGNTGAGTGPHLHFTVSRNGEWIDPETMFKF